jgi:hypothetical protein
MNNVSFAVDNPCPRHYRSECGEVYAVKILTGILMQDKDDLDRRQITGLLEPGTGFNLR